jgi:hypothetical protein
MKDTAADQLIVAAERIRAEAFRSGDEMVIQQAQQLGRSLERAAVYLHGHTLDQITGDATLIVQSKPWQAVLFAFLLGVIFGRRFRQNIESTCSIRSEDFELMVKLVYYSNRRRSIPILTALRTSGAAKKMPAQGLQESRF